MSRITVINRSSANDEQKALLDAIPGQLGMVSNFLKVFANSRVALRAFLGLHGVANGGSLDAATRDADEIAAARAELLEVRAAGYTDADIVEIITHVGINFLTNVLGKASRVEIDFPEVDLKLAA